MKKSAQFISVCALFLPLLAAEAHSGHGITQNAASLFHYLADHQGVTLSLLALTLVVFSSKLAAGRN